MTDLEVVKVRCACGKMACEFTDWDNKKTSDMLFEKFGSLDDHYYFICECGEITKMHYTGYDYLLENLEYERGIQGNVDVLKLSENGAWVQDSRIKGDFKAEEVLPGYSDFYEFETLDEKMVFFRHQNKLEFFRVDYNFVHQQYEVYKFRADEEKVLELFNYFSE